MFSGPVEDRWRKKWLRLETRSQGSRTWRELTEGHQSLHPGIFNNKHLLGKVSKALGERDAGFGDFGGVIPGGDGDPQTRHGLRLLCSFGLCFLHSWPERWPAPDTSASLVLVTVMLPTPSPHHPTAGTAPSLFPHRHQQLDHSGSWKSLWKRKVSPLKESMWQILVFSGQDRRTDGCQTQEPALLVRCICSRALYDVKITLLPSSAS